MKWTDSAIEQLRALWQGGLSTAEIGREMGCSKNCVVGKAHRLGLPARPSPINSAIRTGQARERRAHHLAEAQRMNREGYGNVQIGLKLGINRETVGLMLRKVGLAGQGRRGLPVGGGMDVAPRRAAPRAPIVPALPPAPVAAHPLMRFGATGCRFPIGHPRTPGFRYCNAPDVVQGKPYCAACCARAYVSQQVAA